MATFWTWAFRNPSYLFGGLMLAAGATGVLEWGLSLTGFAVAAVVANAANHLAQKSKGRREMKEAAAARAIQMEGRKKRPGYQNFLENSDVPVEKAA